MRTSASALPPLTPLASPLTDAVSGGGQVEAGLAALDTAVGARVILTPPGPTHRVSAVLALINVCPQSHERIQEGPGHRSVPPSQHPQAMPHHLWGPWSLPNYCIRSTPKLKFRIIFLDPAGMNI